MDPQGPKIKDEATAAEGTTGQRTGGTQPGWNLMAACC